MKKCLRCLIRGRVQGVFFRQSTLKEAERLGVAGWVRNTPTGEVECLLYGEETAVNNLYHWLEQGPPLARVVAIHKEICPLEEHTRFVILR